MVCTMNSWPIGHQIRNFGKARISLSLGKVTYFTGQFPKSLNVQCTFKGNGTSEFMGKTFQAAQQTH